MNVNDANAIRCPKCISHERMYRAPLGKTVRNPYAASGNFMYDECDACNGTGYLPLLIIASIEKSFPNNAAEILGKLRWSGDHFSFDWHGIYVGVEVDGYCHS